MSEIQPASFSARLRRFILARFSPEGAAGLHLSFGLAVLLLAMTAFGIVAEEVRTHAPITISLATDKYRRVDGRWLCTYRRFEHWFEGDTPVTNPKL